MTSCAGFQFWQAHKIQVRSFKGGTFVPCATNDAPDVATDTRRHKVDKLVSPGGPIFYTWATDFPGTIRFFDMRGIEADDISRCTGLTQSFEGNRITLAPCVHRGRVRPGSSPTCSTP